MQDRPSRCFRHAFAWLSPRASSDWLSLSPSVRYVHWLIAWPFFRNTGGWGSISIVKTKAAGSTTVNAIQGQRCHVDTEKPSSIDKIPLEANTGIWRAVVERLAEEWHVVRESMPN